MEPKNVQPFDDLIRVEHVKKQMKIVAYMGRRSRRRDNRVLQDLWMCRCTTCNRTKTIFRDDWLSGLGVYCVTCDAVPLEILHRATRMWRVYQLQQMSTWVSMRMFAHWAAPYIEEISARKGTRKWHTGLIRKDMRKKHGPDNSILLDRDPQAAEVMHYITQRPVEDIVDEMRDFTTSKYILHVHAIAYAAYVREHTPQEKKKGGRYAKYDAAIAPTR